MKKFILFIAIAFVSLTSFANDVNVDASVLKSFNTEFTGASAVTWKIGKDFFKANFQLNGQHVSAYYNSNGDLMATTRNISSLDLPTGLQNNLRKTYGAYWITDLMEISNDDGVQYYISVENADSKLTLSSSGKGWHQFKKSTKI